MVRCSMKRLEEHMKEDQGRMTRLMQRLDEMDEKIKRRFDSLEARLKDLGIWDEQRK